MIVFAARRASPLLLLGTVGLSGCVSLMATKRTYDPAAASPAVVVNGAKVRLQLKPEGTAGGSFAVSAMVVGATVATLDGPFRWRIEAADPTGGLESLTIHRLRTRTAKSGRDEPYPAEHLGRAVEFVKPKGATGPARAVFEVPGLLQVKPREDGALEVLADLSVTGRGRSERRQVRFRLSPSERRQDEFIFVPAEIVRSFGQSPQDWQDQGWD